MTKQSNIIIKQYYCIKKRLKKLTIVKKKQFSRTNVFIQNGPISFNKQAFFNFKHEFITEHANGNGWQRFLPTVYKFGMVYTLVYRCFKICSDWTKFHEELSFLKQVFLKKRILFVIY